MRKILIGLAYFTGGMVFQRSLGSCEEYFLQKYQQDVHEGPPQTVYKCPQTVKENDAQNYHQTIEVLSELEHIARRSLRKEELEYTWSGKVYSRINDAYKVALRECAETTFNAQNEIDAIMRDGHGPDTRWNKLY